MVKSLRLAKKIETESNKRVKEMESKMKQFRNQHAESSAGAKSYDDDESKFMITGKLQERINVQKKIRELHISCVYQYAEVKEMEDISKNYVNLEDFEKPKWYGIAFPAVMWNNEIAIKIHRLQENIGSVNYFCNELKNIGFTPDMIDNVKNGKVYKDLKELETLEKEHDKKKNQDALDGTEGVAEEPVEKV